VALVAAVDSIIQGQRVVLVAQVDHMAEVAVGVGLLMMVLTPVRVALVAQELQLS